MNSKKTLLFSLLLCKAVATESTDQVYKTTWLSGVTELDAVESSKYETFCKELGCLCKNAFGEKFNDSIKPCLAKWSKKYEQHTLPDKDAGKNSKKNAKQIKQISKKMQQDKELSLLVKELAEVFDTYFSDCIDEKDCAYQHVLKIMARYFPETVDLNQVHLDYILWVHEYLEGRLNKKDVLKIDDVSYVLKQFVYYFKQHIPYSTLFSLKKSYEMWMGLSNAIEKGMTGQPADVQRYFLQKVETFIKDSELKTCFATIKSMSLARQELIKNASKNKKKIADTCKLKEYEKLLDTSIAQLTKIVSRHVGDKNPELKFFTMTEKLLFVS